MEWLGWLYEVSARFSYYLQWVAIVGAAVFMAGGVVYVVGAKLWAIIRSK